MWFVGLFHVVAARSNSSFLDFLGLPTRIYPTRFYYFSYIVPSVRKIGGDGTRVRIRQACTVTHAHACTNGQEGLEEIALPALGISIILCRRAQWVR